MNSNFYICTAIMLSLFITHFDLPYHNKGLFQRSVMTNEALITIDLLKKIDSPC